MYPHLLADALTALALVLGLGADKEKAIASLKRFTPGGHRIQTVATATTQDGGSHRFVDDSKATNAHAAKASLNSFADKSVVWIAGGLAKGSRFERLVAEQAHTHQSRGHHRQRSAAYLGRIRSECSRHSVDHHRSGK